MSYSGLGEFVITFLNAFIHFQNKAIHDLFTNFTDLDFFLSAPIKTYSVISCSFHSSTKNSVLLWSIPLTLIQAWSKVEKVGE